MFVAAQLEAATEALALAHLGSADVTAVQEARRVSFQGGDSLSLPSTTEPVVF